MGARRRSVPGTRAEDASQVLLRREELAYRAEQLGHRADPAAKRARHLLELLEVDLLAQWEWSPDRRVFQRNVENLTRRQVKLADQWWPTARFLTLDARRGL